MKAAIKNTEKRKRFGAIFLNIELGKFILW
jgi:hypothetical protein